MTDGTNNRYTAVKICGIRSLADGRAAAEAGADFLGFNFYPKSVRAVGVQTCAHISLTLRQEYAHLRLVGVFVNADEEEVRAVLKACRLDLAQLHGDELPAALQALAPAAFKALRGVPPSVEDYLRPDAPACLIDAAVGGTYGGTGVTGDWTAAAELAQRAPIFLAGGLNPENVAEAMRRVRPWGVDTASGVESAPGVKDAGKVRAFVQAVREAGYGA